MLIVLKEDDWLILCKYCINQKTECQEKPAKQKGREQVCLCWEYDPSETEDQISVIYGDDDDDDA